MVLTLYISIDYGSNQVLAPPQPPTFNIYVGRIFFFNDIQMGHFLMSQHPENNTVV